LRSERKTNFFFSDSRSLVAIAHQNKREIRQLIPDRTKRIANSSYNTNTFFFPLDRLLFTEALSLYYIFCFCLCTSTQYTLALVYKISMQYKYSLHIHIYHIHTPTPPHNQQPHNRYAHKMHIRPCVHLLHKLKCNPRERFYHRQMAIHASEYTPASFYSYMLYARFTDTLHQDTPEASSASADGQRLLVISVTQNTAND
jgi:hypothetical protein